MSEPFAQAQRVRRIAPNLGHFTVYDDRIDGRSDAYALFTPHGTVLVDPLPLTPKALASLGDITAIVLTIQSHQRSSWRYRRSHGARVFAPKGAVGLEEKPDVHYEDGDELPGGLLALRAPGPAFESYVLLQKRRGGLLAFLGDLLIRNRRGDFEFVPDVYMDDPLAARASVARLAALPFLRGLCPGHGAPLLRGAKDAMARALAADERRRRAAEGISPSPG